MRRETPLVVVLLGAALALVLAMAVNWEAGLIVLGGDLLLAASLRLLLTDVRIGLLAIRSRAMDAGMLLATGGALIIISTNLGQVH